MENQHRKITGYRDLGSDEIEKMNIVKQYGIDLQTLVDMLLQDPDTDKRWVAIGRTHFQQGLMALTRSVAKPDFF